LSLMSFFIFLSIRFSSLFRRDNGHGKGYTIFVGSVARSFSS